MTTCLGTVARGVLTLALLVVCVVCVACACEDTGKKSAAAANEHAKELLRLAREDVREIREGLPLGAAQLLALLPKGKAPVDASSARDALERARNRVQDLRIAKSTFFALAGPDGVVIRNDQEQDRMAQKGLFDAFPGLRAALGGKYVETRGSMPEAAEVRGRPDAQWVAAAPVREGAATRLLFVSGWSWSAYAYRLQNALRSSVSSALDERAKVPLLYVYVVVDQAGYAARDSPDVNIQAVLHANVVTGRAGEPKSVELEVTGREFGLGSVLVPELGDKVALAVLRSET